MDYYLEKRGYEDLGNAVIEQAAYDFVKACKRKLRAHDNGDYAAVCATNVQMIKIIEFAHSPLFMLYTNLDPDGFIRACKLKAAMEYAEERRRKRNHS